MPFKNGLAYWAGIGTVEPDTWDGAFVNISSHPGFEDACRDAAQAFIDRHDPRSSIGRLIHDVTGIFLSVFALYLDGCAALTPFSFEQLCGKTRISGAGRASRFLFQMRVLNYVNRDQATRDKRITRYIPTPALLDSMRELFRSELAAFAIVEPDALQIANRFDDAIFFKEYLRNLGNAMIKIADQDFRGPIKIFTDRNNGMHILYHLALCGAKDDHYPPQGSIVFVATDMAKRFGISRSHVRKLLQDAKKQGLLTYLNESEKVCVFSPILRAALLRFHAGIFLGSAACAAAALNAVEIRSE